MAASKTNHAKLGFFVVTGVALAIFAVFWVGAQRLKVEKLNVVTYFNESVQGLDLGAPVKIRGVTIGAVSTITIAPDHRLVEVHSDIFVRELRKLKFDVSADEVPADLRIQLATTGITGIKFLQLDFFGGAASAPPRLSFPPGDNYIPATPSTLKSLEDGFIALSESLPSTLGKLEELMEVVTAKAQAIEVEGILAEVETLVVDARALVRHTDEAVVALDMEAMSTDARGLIGDMRASLGRANELFDRIGGDDGALTRSVARWEALAVDLTTVLETARVAETTEAVRETADAYRGIAHEAGALSIEAQETLIALRETLHSFAALADYLEREPGSVLRGRAPELAPPAEDSK